MKILENKTKVRKNAKAIAIIGLMLASAAIIGQDFAAQNATALEYVIASQTFIQGSTDSTVVEAVLFTAERSTSKASGIVTVAIVQNDIVLATSEMSSSAIKTIYTTVQAKFNAVKVTDDYQVVIMYYGSGQITVATGSISVMGQTTVQADSTAPSVAITSPVMGSTVPTGTITVRGTSSDTGSGVNSVQVRLGSGSYKAATPKATGDWSTWSTTFSLLSGQNTISARATDKTGNVRDTSVTVTASAPSTTSTSSDATSPSVAITSPAANSEVSINGGNVLITGTSSDGGSGVRIVEVRVDSGSYVVATPKAAGDWSNWSVTLPITTGQHRLVPRAIDNAGNTAWNSIYVTFVESTVEDTTSPSIAITNPLGGSLVTLAGSAITIQGTASDSGSGIDIVEVRIDDGSYSPVTPKAAGDWSTWTIALPITLGEHRLVSRAIDNAGNTAWNSIYVTMTNPTSSGSGGDSVLDEFGIEKIYQTKSGGNEWYVNMADPTSDSMFRNLPAMTKQSDGSWQVNGGTRGQVRMEAWSPSNEKWQNVEITMYAKIVSGSNELLQLYSRGGHHTSSNECLGSAIKARLYGDGEARWVKEINHPAYTGNRGSVQATDDPLKGRWVGFKAVIYNFVENGNTYVRMESYIDDDVTSSNGNLVIDNNWQLASVVEDRGGWGTSDSDFNSSCAPLDVDSTSQYRQRDEILSMPGGTSTQNIAAFRSDDLTWNWKYLTVREIVPPS